MCEKSEARGADELTPKDRLDAARNLSRAARGRFDARNETEWKICFGLWTALGVGAGFVVGTDSWRPSGTEAASATVIVLAAVGAFAGWTYQRRGCDELDSRTAYYWESVVERMIECELPAGLQPGGGTWDRAPPPEDGRFVTPEVPKPAFNPWHPGFWGEVVITALFALVAAAAVWGKATARPPPATGTPPPTPQAAARHSGPSCFGSLTRGEAPAAIISSAGYGASSPSSRSCGVRGASHSASLSAGRSTGVRSCRQANGSFAGGDAVRCRARR
ncbi:MAG: hypothetical protein C0501_28930 [Isosphaera sp.]|nr:hypothetical protein [Isosphaera sp.]